MTVGTGEWGKNIVTTAPLFIVPIVGVTATLAKLYVAKKFEDNLWKYIKDQARFLERSASSLKTETPEAPIGVDSRSYDCDYFEGHTGWKEQILGGKLVLFREKGGKNKVLFRGPDGENQKIVIPAQDITSASIISRKKGLQEDDLMIKLECKDESGKYINPVLNLNDDIIKGVLAGINELVGEDKVLRSFSQVRVSTETKYCTFWGSQLSKEARFCSSCGQKQQ